jgi:hypothetical protein
MRPERNTGRASSSGAYRLGVRFATWWLRTYTRRVDPRFTERRESDLTIEIWEHGIAADERRWSPPRAAAGLLIRTVAGMAQDWSWRRSALDGVGNPAVPVAHLLGRRHRPHFWVPLQQGHIFDQTNGMIEAETALPYERGTFGRAGNSPRIT